MKAVKSVAEEFGVTRQTVYEWIRSGKIKAVQVGGYKGALRIDQAEIERVKRDGLSIDKQIIEQGGLL